MRFKTIRPLKENIEWKLYNTGFGIDFGGMTPKAQETTTKNPRQIGCHKIFKIRA